MEETNRTKYLEVKNLNTSFFLSGGRKVYAVRDANLELYNKETLGIVGESGSGKSVLVKSIMRLINYPGVIESGEILLNGQNILKLSEKEMLKIRGRDMSMIFQEPMTALNPSFTIGWQIKEVFKLHGGVPKEKWDEAAIELLKKVKIPDPEKRLNEYPHQFSGGMRQRALIAIALACNPQILFADEPTTALDVTVQADIMDLLDELKRKSNISIVLISHNLNMVTERSDRIIVIYGGQIQESATAEEIVNNPMHPYTIGLMNSLPNIAEKNQKLTAIPGDPPDLTVIPQGCSFAPRCKYATEKCFREQPELVEVKPGHYCKCHQEFRREGGMTNG